MSSMCVPHTPASVSLVRHRMADELAGRLPVAVLDVAALVVSELVGNAVRHGCALPGGGLRASWELADGGLRVEVVDGGDGPVGPPLPQSAEREGGRGLALVQALAASWGSAPARPGTAVWATLPRALPLPLPLP